MKLDYLSKHLKHILFHSSIFYISHTTECKFIYISLIYIQQTPLNVCILINLLLFRNLTVITLMAGMTMPHTRHPRFPVLTLEVRLLLLRGALATPSTCRHLPSARSHWVMQVNKMFQMYHFFKHQSCFPFENCSNV